MNRGPGHELIYSSLEEIRSKFNLFLFDLMNPAKRNKVSDPFVVLSNIVDNEGAVVPKIKNSIVMTLANIQHETTISTFNRTQPINETTYAATSKPIYINLYVMFYANFDLYSQALQFISRTISYFQQTPCFTHDTLPSLNDSVDKLTFELTNLDLTELNYLMGQMGVKYMPSVYYKIRMLAFDSDMVVETVPAVRGIQTPESPKDFASRFTTEDRLVSMSDEELEQLEARE